MVLLNPFQATLYRQLSGAVQPLDEVLAELAHHYRNHPSIHADLFYLLSSIAVSNQEAEGYFAAVRAHRADMEAALGHPVDLRVALMDYFVHVQKRYDSPKIIELRDYEENLTAALADPLTGLLNRRSFDLQLGAEIARCARHGQTFSVMFLDIDGFKAVNDRYGHPLGDAVLQGFARFLEGQLRGEDRVGRYGGEEFALLLPQTDREGIRNLSRRLLERIAATTFPQVRSVSFSAGVAEYPRDGAGAAELMARADELLYRAKNGGKACVCLGDELIAAGGLADPDADGKTLAGGR